MSTELEERSAAELATLDESAASDIVGAIDDEDLQLPVIQITQQLSRAVTDGKVDSGHFFNNVTGKDYGDELSFIIVAYQKGRFYVHNRDKPDEQTFVANGPVAPDTWPSEYAGKTFADIPEAEEQWKERSNAGEIEWGKGPPIVTTHRFVGLAADDLDSPAAISLSRTSAPAAKKILSAIRWSRRAPYSSTFTLKLVGREKGGKPFYAAQATQGEQATDEQVSAAQELFAAIKQAGAFSLTGEEAATEDAPGQAKPETPAGGVEV